MTKINDEVQHNLDILKSLDEAIEKAEWEESLFLRTARKRLIEIRDEFKRDAHLEKYLTNEDQDIPKTLAARIAKRTGLVEVFVLLYNADGKDLYRWEQILNSIQGYIVSRPVYRFEKDVKAALRAAVNKSNEAYIAAFINEHEILEMSPEKTPRDRAGIDLLTLRDGAIKKDHITRFIHQTGVYEFENEKLIRHSPAEFI